MADEDLIESEVFIFGDVPQICPQASFVMIKEFRGGLKFAAGLQHNGHERAVGLWSGGGAYRKEGYVLVSDWHGLSCCYVESHGYNRMSIGWRTKLCRISDLRQSGYQGSPRCGWRTKIWDMLTSVRQGRFRRYSIVEWGICRSAHSYHLGQFEGLVFGHEQIPSVVARILEPGENVRESERPERPINGAYMLWPCIEHQFPL